MLTISIAMILVAPAVYFLALRYKKACKALERLIFIAVGALVVLHLLPESYEVAGWTTILAALSGMFLPSILERLWQSQARSIHLISVLVSVAGLAVHSMMDGAAIALPEHATHCHHGHDHAHDHFLPLAVILHRLPVGILLFGMFYPKHGFQKSFGVLLFVSLMTLVGYHSALSLLSGVSEQLLAYFQALVSGSLLHIILDQHSSSHDHH